MGRINVLTLLTLQNVVMVEQVSLLDLISRLNLGFMVSTVL